MNVRNCSSTVHSNCSPPPTGSGIVTYRSSPAEGAARAPSGADASLTVPRCDVRVEREVRVEVECRSGAFRDVRVERDMRSGRVTLKSRRASVSPRLTLPVETWCGVKEGSSMDSEISGCAAHGMLLPATTTAAAGARGASKSMQPGGSVGDAHAVAAAESRSASAASNDLRACRPRAAAIEPALARGDVGVAGGSLAAMLPLATSLTTAPEAAGCAAMEPLETSLTTAPAAANRGEAGEFEREFTRSSRAAACARAARRRVSIEHSLEVLVCELLARLPPADASTTDVEGRSSLVAGVAGADATRGCGCTGGVAGRAGDPEPATELPRPPRPGIVTRLPRPGRCAVPLSSPGMTTLPRPLRGGVAAAASGGGEEPPRRSTPPEP